MLEYTIVKLDSALVYGVSCYLMLCFSSSIKFQLAHVLPSCTVILPIILLTSNCLCTSPHLSWIFLSLISHIFSNLSFAVLFSPSTASTIASSRLQWDGKIMWSKKDEETVRYRGREIESKKEIRQGDRNGDILSKKDSLQKMIL